MGIKIELLSFENILWALKSLVFDRITLTESAVLSRIKESFGLSINHKSWKSLLKQFKAYIEKIKHNPKPQLPNSPKAQRKSNIEDLKYVSVTTQKDP